MCLKKTLCHYRDVIYNSTRQSLSLIQTLFNMASGSNGQDDGYKSPRHPRWTQQETLVLIEGKRIVEGRGRKGRKSSSVSGPDNNVEPKWDAVSSHCRRNGVDRGPVQCRKRWSNLLSDFKKIKAWDGKVKGGDECFWTMRSDLRRENKLPGFFDKEVYDVFDGDRVFTNTPENQLALVTVSVEEDNGDGTDDVEVENDEDDENDEFERDVNVGKEKIETDDDKTSKIPSPVPISEVKYQAYTNQDRKRQPGPDFRRGSEYQKEEVKRRKQSSSDRRNADVDDSFVKALERNMSLLNAQLEEQKVNSRLDREQKKEQHDSLMAVLTKITDALEKIANKM
ncbi:hypothetical protein CASFOL_037948 [Castilleja foliolosa]|uniref:Myb-like domain-containing protein n=1 Tax=Castilleja foliolosa TaxID=1961234 RepID=A0ABD3BLK1_9LAMI